MPTPNTTIILYKGVPLDRDYRHTMYFASVSAQNTFFVNYTKVGGTFNNLSYQRISSNKIRVQASADNLKDCNYLAIKNTGYSTKVYYAFIIDVEYINENTCEITYEEDVIQTYLFDGSVTLEECFVEREHSATDQPGDNLQPENIDPGEYVMAGDGTGEISTNNDYDIVVGIPYNWTVFENQFSPYSDAGFYTGIFSGYKFYVFNSGNATDIAGLKTFIENVGDNPQLVTGSGTSQQQDPVNIMGSMVMFTAPTVFRPAGDSTSGVYIPTPTNTRVPSGDVTKIKTPITKIGNYTPKNKKLLTYPFNMMYVTNPQGQSAVFNYEFFTGGTPTFRIMCAYAPGVQVVLYPTNYKGLAFNYPEKFSLGTFPLVPFNVDSYNSWLAQHENSDLWKSIVNGVKTVGGVALGAAAFSTGNAAAAGAAGSMIGQGLNGMIAQATEQSERRVDAAHSSGSSANDTMLANGLFDFRFYNKHITEEYAQKIDLYFSMYGYACNKVKVPNISARPIYNYVKTNKCCLKGNANAAVLQKIENIFNNGITFWKNAAYFGNYTTSDNSPVTP